MNTCGTRILNVTPWFPPHRGGIAQHVSGLYAQLTGLGYKVSILSVKPFGEKSNARSVIKTQQSNVEYIRCFYLPGWPYPTLKSVSIPIDLGAKLCSCIRKEDFDLVHVHGIHYPICWLSLYLAHKRGIASVLSLHGTFALNPNVLGGESKLENWLYGHFFSRIMSYADAVIGPTEGVTRFAQRYAIYPSTSFHTVEYGLDTDKFKSNLHLKREFRKIYNIDQSAVVLLFAGRFEKVKGVLEFCMAAKKIVEVSRQGVEVIIVGTGSLRKQVYSIVRNTQGIHLFEWQAEEEIHKFYIASDIFVIPSRFEAMPITILEAMNCGLHILYAAVGGIPDVLEGYPSKTLLRGISDMEIYYAIKKLISRRTIAKETEDSLVYARQFDWNNIIHRITSVYDSVICSNDLRR